MPSRRRTISLLGFFTRELLAVTRALLSRIPADGPGVTADDLVQLKLPTLVIGHGHDHAHPLVVAELRAALADFLG